MLRLVTRGSKLSGASTPLLARCFYERIAPILTFLDEATSGSYDSEVGVAYTDIILNRLLDSANCIADCSLCVCFLRLLLIEIGLISRDGWWTKS